MPSLINKNNILHTLWASLTNTNIVLLSMKTSPDTDVSLFSSLTMYATALSSCAANGDKPNGCVVMFEVQEL